MLVFLCYASMSAWFPSSERIQNSRLAKFAENIPHKNYQELHQWSVDNIPEFWDKLWDFCEVIGDKGDGILTNENDIEKAVFYPNASINFAENLLKYKGSDIAISFIGEDKVRQDLSYDELYLNVAKVADHFANWGVSKGDRVAGYLPNMPETVKAMLAATSLGAVWTACSPDFGVQGVIDRFSQIQPKVLVTVDGYYYNGKAFSCLDRLDEILAALPSVERVVVVSYLGLEHDYPKWSQLLATSEATKINFVRVNFNDPLYILYSSGTTGIPKCIVHGVGGTLLKHLSEHAFHSDIHAGDRVFYFTTCSWMMWHWLVSALASKAHIILFDGAPTYPKADYLWDIADEYKINFFGTSAKYLSSLHKLGVDVRKSHDLSELRSIGSTGSPLLPETFDYIWQNIKQDVQIGSLSGGTDIVSCFVMGNSLSPVYRGEIQGPTMGIAVDVFDSNGKALQSGCGELVCTKPFPCRPISFWNDASGSKYHNAYYARFQNIWHHGDFCEWTQNNGIVIHGRSDATLNPGGVRIGTAEIYRQIENIHEIQEGLAIGQKWEDDERVILFVVLKEGFTLDEPLTAKVKQHIRSNTTPRHVPAKIIAVNDLPRTKNNKLSEIVVRDVVHGREINNKEALLNPESIGLFSNLKELQI
jgi:acetoacetyl-CoA synthetase